jgi:hypothetical protein
MLSNFLKLETKGIHGLSLTTGGSPTEDLVVLTIAKFQIDSHLSVMTMVYAELHKVKL